MGISISLGLLAALFYGTANFTVRPACQGAGIFRTMLYGQWLAHTVPHHRRPGPRHSPRLLSAHGAC